MQAVRDEAWVDMMVWTVNMVPAEGGAREVAEAVQEEEEVERSMMVPTSWEVEVVMDVEVTVEEEGEEEVVVVG